MSNIILTGFMGTGKSTVGRLLAERLGWEFVDTDAVLEQDHGSISDIFDTHGEAAFRGLEHNLAVELAQRVGLVIATGGRMLLDPRNAAALDTTGQVFCLSATAAELIERLTADEQAKRPLLSTDDPKQAIVDLLAERASGYGEFEQISTSDRTPDQIVEIIIGRLN